MAAFSRLQLAAALIEYDNDSGEENATTRREANQSAIFSHLRRRNMGPRTKTISGLTPHPKPPSTDYLSVPLPSDVGSTQGGRRPAARVTEHGSISSLQNPFHADIEEDDPELLNDEPEVDLSSWGIDSILPPQPKEKGKKKKSKKSVEKLKAFHAQSEIIPSTLPIARGSLAVDELGLTSKLGVANSMPVGQRRHSVAWDHLASEPGTPGPSNPPVSRPITMLMGSDQPLLPQDNAGRTSMDSQRPKESEDLASPRNPFAPPLPAGRRLSRFDPKVVAHVRTNSGDITDHQALPSPEAGARFPRGPRSVASASIAPRPRSVMTTTMDEPRSPGFLAPSFRSRSPSNRSRRSELLSDEDEEEYEEEQPRNYRFSRADLMRPKVLVMPSPLRAAEPENEEAPSQFLRDGFDVSTTGPPLPPGAKTNSRPGIRPLSSYPPLVASNSFTPNPRLSMTLSQLTFRNTLLVGGNRDVSYVDIDGQIPRAATDGEQVTEGVQETATPPEPEVFRPAGKLFGRSLIDELENRKSQMRSKQRVFMGDQRPSMMDRNRSSTLITLQDDVQDEESELQRRSSRKKTLIDLNEESRPGLSKPVAPRSTSVFGVDKLWEREVARLKEIEAQEAEEERIRSQAEAEAGARKASKNNRKSILALPTPPAEQPVAPSQGRRESAPILPDVQLASAPRKAPQESDSDSDDSDRDSFQIPASRPKGDDWFAGSSDDGKVDANSAPRLVVNLREDDSDDDLPLARRLDEVKMYKAQSDADGSDEDKPLATVLQKIAGSTLPSPPIIREVVNLKGAQSDDEEDDLPLAVRRATIHVNNNDADDDTPLAFRRSTAFGGGQDANLMQQQLMMQAHLRTSYFGPQPSVVGGFSPMAPPLHPMMMPPQPFGPPPFVDMNNFGRVDAWRRTVE